MTPLDDIPLVDDHAHPMLPPEAAAREPFARYFTEAHDTATIAAHAPHALFYRHALRELAELLGCEPAEREVIAARAAQPFAAHLSRLLFDANVETVLLDDGYPRTGALSVAETAAAGGVRAHRVVRIERLAEDLIAVADGVSTFARGADSLLGLSSVLVQELESARPRLVALKSIIAYRGGLIIDQPAREAAEGALAAVRQAWAGTPGRLAAKPLLDHLFLVAADWAARSGVPLQIHTGFGDRDVDLRLASPLHLRPLLEGGPVSLGPVVLLHASYPYVREAAYLASVYPNVYVDISEAAPLLAGPGLTRVLEELLALAPVTKILYGSDAWGIPEWFWLAARAARRALAEALAWLPAAEARWAARRILHDNAAELYGLGG